MKIRTIYEPDNCFVLLNTCTRPIIVTLNSSYK
jgi:hypothetical protein